MSMSLDALRASDRTGLPERTYPLCLASALVGEVQSVLTELREAEQVEAARQDSDNPTPRRVGEPPVTAPIRARLATLRDEMAEHTGTLTLQAVTEGKWRTWVDEHPAREGNKRDAQIAYGCCNADDLLDDLEQFATKWNEDPIKPGDWDFILANAAPGDVKSLVQLVVVMHETAVDVPKLLSGSLGILDGETD